MNLKKINEKISSKQNKVQWSVQNAMLNRDDSYLFCEKCKGRLGLISMVHYAMFKKKGEKYVVPCRHCNHKNIRVKGEFGKKIDADWDKYGF